MAHSRLELHHRLKPSCAVLPPSRIEAFLPPMLERQTVTDRNGKTGETVVETTGPMVFICSRCKEMLWGPV